MDIRELLSAYLCGDVRPEERAVVERLLSDDAALRALARDLKALLPLLKAGARPVSEALLAALHSRVTQMLAAGANTPGIGALLCASLSGDLNAQETERLTRHLAEHPEAKDEQQALKALLQVLRKGQLPVSTDLEKRLTERLSASLPAAAGIGKAGGRRRESSRRETVRAIVAPQLPWRARLYWIGAAAAALLLLVFGLARVLGTPSPTVGTAAKEKGEPPAPKPEGVRPETPAAPRQWVNEKPEDATRREIAVKRQGPDEVQAPLAPDVVPEDRNVARTPEQTPQVPPAPDTIRNEPEKAVAKGGATAPPREKTVTQNNTTKQEPSPGVGVAPGVQRSPGRTSTDGVAIAPSTTATQQSVTPTAPVEPVAQDNANIAPVAGAAKVLIVQGGTAEATTAAGPLTLTTSVVVPSGSKVTTGQGRVGFVLPGDGRLWVNSGSALTLTLSGLDTIVNLTKGEIAYRAPAGGGDLTVHSGSVQVTQAKGVDAKLQANALEVCVLKQQATVSTKGKALKATSGYRVIAALSGNEALRKEPYGAPAPDYWSSDLQLFEKQTTGEKKDGRSRTRGRQTRP
ncbi:MAG: hypothetical protein NTW87_30650 [Planctomycetota bacterium]|nr:hypothetical protein [Planctomycetota bacterium]